jgi:hypothetical protein
MASKVRMMNNEGWSRKKSWPILKYPTAIFVKELREITKNFIRDISRTKVGWFTLQETYLLAASFPKDIFVHDVRHTLLELVNA